MSPTLTYDREANALYLRLTAKPIDETIALSDSVYLDVDAEGEPVGLEILDASTVDLATIPDMPATALLRDLVRPQAA
ncbi:MAG: DUF2283 domain-containing protein [Thermomicrobiales bacterium]